MFKIVVVFVRLFLQSVVWYVLYDGCDLGSTPMTSMPVDCGCLYGRWSTSNVTERDTLRNVKNVVGLRSSTNISLCKMPVARLQFDGDQSMHKVELPLGLSPLSISLSYEYAYISVLVP